MTRSDDVLGYFLVGGFRLPVVAVRLEGGAIVFTAEADPPPRRVAGPVTVFGADGVGVCQGTQEVVLEPIQRQLVVVLEYRLRVGRLEDVDQARYVEVVDVDGGDAPS